MKTTVAVRVRMENQQRWAQIAFSLLDPLDRGPVLIYPEGFACRIQADDDLAATYGLKNWESALMSGAFYAFRRRGGRRSRILVSELEGCLGSEDMAALAAASTIAVTELLEGDVSDLTAPGWRYQLNP